MAKLNIIILDSDKIFLEKISSYLINKTNNFTVSFFTDFEKFKEFIRNTKQDIILFSDEYISQIKFFESSAVKILITETSETATDEYASIKKYQKLDKFVNDILFTYSEKTGDSSFILSDNKEKKIIAVYSPVGGSGKTTLSILLAKNLSLSRAKVLYLNFERVSSMAGIFNNDGINNMTDIFFAAKTNKKNIPAKILSNAVQNQASKIYYINPAESCTEYAQMTDEEIMDIIHAAEGLKEFDYIIIDFVGEFNKRVFEILKRCRKIIFPYLDNELSKQKVTLFKNEMIKLKYEESILINTIFVENMSEKDFSDDEILKIPNNENYKNIQTALRNHNIGFNDLEPIIRQL